MLACREKLPYCTCSLSLCNQQAILKTLDKRENHYDSFQYTTHIDSKSQTTHISKKVLRISQEQIASEPWIMLLTI